MSEPRENAKWIRVSTGIYELASDRTMFIIHWEQMHPEPPEYPEDNWELYSHENGDNVWWDSARTLRELQAQYRGF